ncbi:MAG TPA: xanthine phosphoribosyltransferase [bacterium]|nr:xanthine phosphoribosyltransferase [bacterium]
MDTLRARILSEGRNLGGGILKVDGFINHQIDPLLMNECGRELARRFRPAGATKVLTAEISGIAPALSTAQHLGVPVLYARKTRPITMPDQVLLTAVPSHTKERTVELIVSPEYLAHEDRVLIVDDFLATGHTILGLARLAGAAGARLVGIGVVIEKAFEGGRAALEPLGVPIESLAIVTDMSGGRIVLA